MRIGTWNIERLKHKSRLSNIKQLLLDQRCDILVLTEYDTRLDLENYPYSHSTTTLCELDSTYYRATEKRVRIFSKYPIISKHNTYNSFTSCAALIETPMGKLLVYGTIIGVLGNRHQSFKDDLKEQRTDFSELSKDYPLCIIGDYNLSFSDAYYFTKEGRQQILDTFQENDMKHLTYELKECIDHIAISEGFVKNSLIDTWEWNINKKENMLSDHKGTGVTLLAQNYH